MSDLICVCVMCGPHADGTTSGGATRQSRHRSSAVGPWSISQRGRRSWSDVRSCFRTTGQDWVSRAAADLLQTFTARRRRQPRWSVSLFFCPYHRAWTGS